MKYAYPEYGIDFTREMLQQCCDVAVRLVAEEGLLVRHEKFLDAVRGKPGVTVDGQRVRFDRPHVENALERAIEKTRRSRQERAPRDPHNQDREWVVETGSFSIAFLDPVTNEVRDATCEDLRACIRLVNAYGLGGYYPCVPQDVPPLMRVLSVFKICWENSDKIRPWDYSDIRQVPFLYEMHRVMGKPFPINICVTQPLAVDEYTLDYFLSMYDTWRKNGDVFITVGDYPMLGISKPVTSTGCFTMTLADFLAVHMLFKAFDPEIEVGVSGNAGQPTDLRAACWAWGSPRGHLYRYLNDRLWAVLCGADDGVYLPGVAHFESSSSATDQQAALEKMAIGLEAAFHGVRFFRGAGSLCVDDLYSPTQFVIDLEIFRYIRETVEAFNGHPDILALDGLYEVCRDCVRGDDEFISHPDTVARFRNIVPSFGMIRREKLRAWLAHREILADRARDEAIERMDRPNDFHLPDDKQKELDRIYARAEKDLAG